MSLNTEVDVALCFEFGTSWIEPQPAVRLMCQLLDDPQSMRNGNVKHPHNITYIIRVTAEYMAK
jgi:hypothetical protein